MDLGSIFIISALLLMTVFFVLHPFYEPAPEKQVNAVDITPLVEEQERILEDLHDLDFDYSIGKIPKEEYPIIRSRLLHQGAEILRQIDHVRNNQNAAVPAGDGESDITQTGGISDPLFDTLETKISERRRMKLEKAASFCPRCGSPLLKSDVYCWKCGHKTE